MTLEILQSFLGWCSIINIGIIIFWFIMITIAKETIYKLHSIWFKIEEDKFDVIQYKAIAFYKITVFIFNVVPYVVLLIIN